MSMNSQMMGHYEDLVFDVRLQLEKFVVKNWKQNTADTVEHHLTELAEAIVKANCE